MSVPKISVMIVDDSATARRILKEIIERHPGLEVIASVTDPYKAVEVLKKRSPDVIVLDVQMPRMDGLTFLKKLMKIKPLPVVMCSSFTERGSSISLQCLENGAVDIIAKPKSTTRQEMQDLETRIHDTLQSAAGARFDAKHKGATASRFNERRLEPSIGHAEKHSADAILPPPIENQIARIPKTQRIIALGASTGGVDAIRAFLESMPENCPGIVMVQHMPEHFTASFAKRLDEYCAIEVREAKSGDFVEPGIALLAPGDRHMILKRSGQRYFVEITDGPLVNRHRPSVDVLFRSVAIAAGANATGVILTGMGDDGAAGMLEMKKAGAFNVAQDEASSVVFGMPKEAIKLGGVDKVLALADLAASVLKRSC